jgi:hypothetical protein
MFFNVVFLFELIFCGKEVLFDCSTRSTKKFPVATIKTELVFDESKSTISLCFPARLFGPV